MFRYPVIINNPLCTTPLHLGTTHIYTHTHTVTEHFWCFSGMPNYSYDMWTMLTQPLTVSMR